MQMNWTRSIAGAMILAFGLLTAGCAHHYYRVYDPYYSDYHQWTPQEDAYYHQWYTQTYHDRGYRDYRHLNKDEQRSYWNWRHNHGGDHDHDRH